MKNNEDLEIKQLLCHKCGKNFNTRQKLQRHSNKKIECVRILQCNRCNKVFSRSNDLKRHINRKTPCEHIQGDPTKQVPNGSCHFCYKKFKNKYSLKNHFNICKIKNGGMALLFKKVKHLEQENREMRVLVENNENVVICSDHINNTTIQNIETQNIANHHNTVFNFTLINFGEGQEEITKILSLEAPKLLNEDPNATIPIIKQIQDRIIGLVMKIHRNPKQKQLQNIYVTDPEKPKDNAFVHEDGKWNITDWYKLNKIVLNNLYNNLSNAGIKNKEDKLKVMKHIFIEGGCGDNETIKKMTDNDIAEMYLEIGKKLNFKTISL
jgi:uncharacterized C2H2 Zn-finger protein